jgi:hypothetical protein
MSCICESAWRFEWIGLCGLGADLGPHVCEWEGVMGTGAAGCGWAASMMEHIDEEGMKLLSGSGRLFSST